MLPSLVVAFAIGDHENVIAEGAKVVSQSGAQRDDKEKALVYMWLASLALGDQNPTQRLSKYKHGLLEDGNLKDCLALLTAITLRKRSTANLSHDDDAIQRAVDLLPDASNAGKYVLALALLECGAIERSFEAVRRFDDDVDCQVLIVRMLMGISRVDAARVRVEEMKRRFGPDEVRVQVAEACLVQPFETEERAVRDAVYTCQELAELHRPTDKLTLTQAICLERLGKMDEARALLDRHPSSVPYIDASHFVGTFGRESAGQSIVSGNAPRPNRVFQGQTIFNMPRSSPP